MFEGARKIMRPSATQLWLAYMDTFTTVGFAQTQLWTGHLHRTHVASKRDGALATEDHDEASLPEMGAPVA